MMSRDGIGEIKGEKENGGGRNEIVMTSLMKRRLQNDRTIFVRSLYEWDSEVARS